MIPGKVGFPMKDLWVDGALLLLKDSCVGLPSPLLAAGWTWGAAQALLPNLFSKVISPKKLFQSTRQVTLFHMYKNQ
jgi:hypothetical protein